MNSHGRTYELGSVGANQRLTLKSNKLRHPAQTKRPSDPFPRSSIAPALTKGKSQ
jgi:hypothetical protein